MSRRLPNLITLARLGLTIILLAILAALEDAHAPSARQTLQACFWLFIVAALGDALDGYLARRLSAESAFGRLVDPLVDKVLVCGLFALLAGPTFVQPAASGALVAPWMVVVVFCRELLVTSLRGEAEARSHAFAATAIGKAKMLVQCVALGVVLASLSWPELGLAPGASACIWTAVVVTLASAAPYVSRAIRLFREERGAARAPGADAASARAAQRAGEAAA